MSGFCLTQSASAKLIRVELPLTQCELKLPPCRGHAARPASECLRYGENRIFTHQQSYSYKRAARKFGLGYYLPLTMLIYLSQNGFKFHRIFFLYFIRNLNKEVIFFDVVCFPDFITASRRVCGWRCGKWRCGLRWVEWAGTSAFCLKQHAVWLYLLRIRTMGWPELGRILCQQLRRRALSHLLRLPSTVTLCGMC